jgi:acyl dehydratase
VTAAAAPNAGDAEPFPCHVDADAVYAFARATNDDTERYARGDAVPPLFTSQFVLGAQLYASVETNPEPEVDNFSISLHGEHDVFFHRPIRPGMELQSGFEFVSARQRPGGVAATSRFTLSDEEGLLAVEHYWTNFYVLGTIAADVGAPPPNHTFDEGARRRPFGSTTVTVDRDQTYRYAGVSHDHAPHAIDEAAAWREGYPAKILQGLCTFALCSVALVDLVAERDPNRLRRLAGRFSAPVLAGREFVVDVYDAGITADGGRSLAFEAVQDGVVVIKHGRVDIAEGGER